MQLLSTIEAANLLGVSAATVRNWAKTGHLHAVTRKPATFKEGDIHELKERIRTNRFNRLRKRANKTASDKPGVVTLGDARVSADIDRLLDNFHPDDVDPQSVVFAAALHYLVSRGEIDIPPGGDIAQFNRIRWRRRAMRSVMKRWHDRNGGRVSPTPPDRFEPFLAWDHPDDRLGLLYQGLSSAGKKSLSGAFFTPPEIIEDSLGTFEDAPATFLDPCCGTGRFLLRAADRFDLEPERLFGFDADPAAVDIACVNLLLRYTDHDEIPRVHCLDSLNDLATGSDGCPTNALAGAIDAIATNPPWGGCKNLLRYRNLADHIKSGESFSLFLEKSLHLLRPGGGLSFILPEAILKIKAHTDIRQLLLERTTIRGITLLGRIFPGVATSIIRLDLVKRPAPAEWRVRIDWDGRRHHTSQRRFQSNVHRAFDVTVTDSDAMIIDKIYSLPHHTLRGHAEWALGIVTGDNAHCVLDDPCEGSEPVLRGRDVFKFATRPPKCHIVFAPERFQQVAPERFYRAGEKLVYRFVSDKLVFAYDDQGLLTLNSANIVIPRLPHMSMLVALAFLNSSVFHYLFMKRFQTRKVLRGDLETLPFPMLPVDVLNAFERQVKLCMGGEYRPAEELDRMVYRTFRLTDEEAGRLEEGLRADCQREFL